MYTMNEICKKTGISYETLKYYCNEGLVPHVKRDKNNYRIFDEHDLKWIESLECLKKCNMSIQEMKEYLNLCLQGQSTIPIRQELLDQKRELLVDMVQKLNDSIAYLDRKQEYYAGVLSGKYPYVSNLIKPEES